MRPEDVLFVMSMQFAVVVVGIAAQHTGVFEWIDGICNVPEYAWGSPP